MDKNILPVSVILYSMKHAIVVARFENGGRMKVEAKTLLACLRTGRMFASRVHREAILHRLERPHHRRRRLGCGYVPVWSACVHEAQNRSSVFWGRVCSKLDAEEHTHVGSYVPTHRATICAGIIGLAESILVCIQDSSAPRCENMKMVGVCSLRSWGFYRTWIS